MERHKHRVPLCGVDWRSISGLPKKVAALEYLSLSKNASQTEAMIEPIQHVQRQFFQ